MFKTKSPAALQCAAGSLAVLAIALSGCGPTPPPIPTATPPPPAVALVVNPDITDVLVGQTVALIAETSGKDLRFKWSAAKGKLSTFDEPAIFYTAPDSAGVDTVTVEVSSSSGTTIEHVSFNVIIPDTPIPTATAANTPTSTPTPAPNAVVVASVNLRSGPGTEYDIISTLSPGQVLTVTGQIADTTWLQVNTDQVQGGWVINRPDLVTLNLPVAEIPIVSTPSLTMPEPMSFQNFEPDNGTLGDYCWDVWFATCSFESTIVRKGSRAVRVDAHAEAAGTDGNGGTVGIYPSSSDPIDLSSATTLSVWVYDTQGNNDVELKLRDYNDALSNAVWSEMQAEQNNWTELTWSLSDFTGVDLSQIKNIELYEWWDGVYYFDAVSWQIAMPTPATTALPTEAPMPIPTATLSPTPSCQITGPADRDENLGYQNIVRVTCSDVPDSLHIWILVYSHHDSSYYPQPGPLGSGSGQYEGMTYLGTENEGIGYRFGIVVALADEAANTRLQSDAVNHIGWPDLPDGVEEKARITVRRGPSIPRCWITQPADEDENLGHANEVRITCSDVPDSLYVWVLVYSHHDFNYYPQPGPIGSGSGQRRGTTYLGTPTEGIGHRFGIIVALANEAVSLELRQAAESFSGYIALPDGVQEKDRIIVTRGH